MAKASAKVKGTPQPVPEGETTTTTYSTRFDARQRELIEEAAKLRNCTAAKFIRDAAVTRAADVVNASSGHSQLYKLAGIVRDQLLNPVARVVPCSEQVPFEPQPEKRISRSSREQQLLEMQDREDEFGQVQMVRDVEPLRPHDSDLEQIRRALETCGTELVEMVLSRWAEATAGEYRPKVTASDLLSGSGTGEPE